VVTVCVCVCGTWGLWFAELEQDNAKLCCVQFYVPSAMVVMQCQICSTVMRLDTDARCVAVSREVQMVRRTCDPEERPGVLDEVHFLHPPSRRPE
jgi:hypothetical protein